MKKKKINIAVILITIALCVSATYIIFAANPGEQDNPLISLSYINDVLKPEIKTMMQEQSSSSFKAVFIEKNNTVYCDGGTELILRTGSAVVASPFSDQGLSNMTGGEDALNGAPLKYNNMYVVPRTDNRGFITKEDCFVMIKGNYKIVK